MTKLSICIPTFNRAADLRRALWAFLPQLTASVEIVVSDNGSSDTTQTVVEAFKREHPNVTYFRWPENMGADRNFLNVIAIANGQYCWLFGSDDLVEPGAISGLLRALNSGDDIYLFNRVVSNEDYCPFSKDYLLDPSLPAQTFDTTNPADLRRYVKSADILGGLFSFLSSIVVRRDAWNSIKYDEAFTGTAYSHSFVLMSLLKRGCRVRYLKEFYVNCRFGNDSFANDGDARRILLDFRGFGMIRDTLFKDDAEVAAGMNAVLCRSHPWWRLGRRRINMSREGWESVCAALRAAGYSGMGLFGANVLSHFSGVLRVLLSIKHYWETLHSPAESRGRSL